MIIRSVRLKNIKSYGEGADGQGITVRFQSGINRVAGRNGNGKTTLIEGLGYALFFCDPQFQESFRLPTYFLRSGEKEGSIEVVFEHENVAYRVERGIGQGKIRSKVVQLIDGSACANDDAEVSAFLCRLLGFKNPRQLSDLFANLIGVKQGRLTWPFDSKPSSAKEFFEPLLDVAVFRESELRLRDAQARFRELIEKQNVELATIQERIRERSDTLEKVSIKEAQVAACAKAVEKSRKEKEQAEREKQAWELKESSVLAAKTSLERANAALGLEVERCQTAQQRVREAQAAGDIVERTRAHYQAYERADQNLVKLQQRQIEKSKLEQERGRSVQLKLESEGRLKAAQQQAMGYREQKDEKTKSAKVIRNESTAAQKLFEEGRENFELLAEAIDIMRQSSEAVQAWHSNLAKDATENKGGRARFIKEWGQLVQARAEMEREQTRVEDLSRQSIAAEELKKSLARQLEQISGGICPFLQEKCRQFEPAKVRSQITEQQERIAQLRKNRDSAIAIHRAAKQNWERLMEAKSSDFDGQRVARLRLEHDLEHRRKTLTTLDAEIATLALKIERETRVSAQSEAQAAAAAKEIAALDEKLKAFAELDREIAEEQKVKERTAEAYKQFLGVKSKAEGLERETQALKKVTEAETEAKANVEKRKSALEQAGKDFDPMRLEKARTQAGASEAKMGLDARALKQAEEELKQEEERRRQWKEACAQRERIEAELDRLKAACELAKFAGKVLKGAAPAVAQHLCSRIAAHAQKLFNQISQETIELEWKAEPNYSLRISPGDRRFAMLSGGEQTKLALAMTLAMIQEFSGLRFAVFDEPTYAVDGESRQKLADAIVEVQKACGLDQMIVVSHDDSFDGKIEHVVMLNKRAGVGTEITDTDFQMDERSAN